MIDRERDELLTAFGKHTLQDRYLLEGEDFQDLFARVARVYGSNADHAQRMYDYISKLWFMPATPVLSNGGTDRGLPISCFLNNVEDSMKDIAAKWQENIWLGAGGGGIGTCWSGVRSVGEPVAGRGGSSGVIPFIKVMDSQTLAISQGSLRRGAGAAYLDLRHPEVEEFLEIRKPSGDFNRKSLNLHHGLVVPDAFMTAVENDGIWQFTDPKSGQVRGEARARELWERILETRMQTGEPYLLFEGNVSRGRSEVYKQLGLDVRQSNLCSEIMLATGVDHRGWDRTAVCCLGSVNLARYDDWSDNGLFVADCLEFLDNVLQDFIDKTEKRAGFRSARYAAERERAVGLGAMGFHTYLQEKGIPFESVMAQSYNMRMFKHIQTEADKANVSLAQLRGACPDAAEAGLERRFSHMLSIAPTASISIICGQASACVEPWNTNIYTAKTMSGSFTVKNATLDKLIRERCGDDYNEVWVKILGDGGSVRDCDALSDDEKDVFKTAWEIDQRWVVELAADRSEFIDQGQSINLFLGGATNKWDLLQLHYQAWKKGVKSLYYLRSQSVQRAGVADDNKMDRTRVYTHANYEECLSCQ